MADVNSPEEVDPVDDDGLITDAKEFLQACIDADDGNRSEALADLEFIAGRQWPDQAKRKRELEGRPCLTINKLPTFLHQVTNDQRMNVPGIKVSPVDSRTDPETAEIVQGLIRHIEYASNADVAYDTAVNHAATIGFGYFRLVTDYEREDSFDQCIRFKRIRNPFTVYFDPMSEEPDGSDAKRAMISTRVPRKRFERDYPDANATKEGFNTGTGDSTKRLWLAQDFVRIAEYYRIEQTPDELLLLADGTKTLRSQIDEALARQIGVANFRPTTRSRTMLYKLTAVDVLESTEVKCRWVPVFPVYGVELDIDGKVIRHGLVRHAKDPAQMYNFWMTSATEEIALRPKTPYIGAEGQFEGYEDDWGRANVDSIPYLEYKPVGLEGVLAPPPARQPMSDVPAGVLAMAMHANDNIKSTTGLFDSSLGARGSATSGIQERAQQRQGDVANFHYADNLNRTVRHVGRCLVDMIPHYYDASRIVRVMGEDDAIKPVEINQVTTQQNDEGQAVEKIVNDLSVGEYDITVRAGPSYDTLRQEAAESMIELGGKWPRLMEVAGDKVVKAMDWPDADGIAERIAKTIPAEIRGTEDGEDQAPVVQTPQGPVPVEQAGQLIAEMGAAVEQLQGELAEAQSGIAKARIDAESREEVARINAASRQDVEELKGLVQLLVNNAASAEAAQAVQAVDDPPAAAVPAQPDQTALQTQQLLAQLVTALSQPQAAPRIRRRMQIQAPSGAMYVGEIADEPDEPAPPEAAPLPTDQGTF